jgi:hypothetical protein
MMAQARTRIDVAWTLGVIYATYVVISLPMQQKVWSTLASNSGSSRTFLTLLTILGLFVVTFGAIALAAYLAPLTSVELSARVSEQIRKRMGLALLLLLLLAAVTAVAVAYGVLDCFPNSGDEFAYLFQARLFANGELWAEAPPLGETFVPYRTWIIGDKWVSQYPPGWPLAMAAAIIVGIPVCSVNAFFGAACATGMMSSLWQLRDRFGGLMAIGSYVITPFFILNAASFHSHMLSALLIVLLCLCCLWYQRDRRVVALVTSGSLLGLIGLTRYFTLILILPALCYWIFVENHRSRSQIIWVWALAALPFLGLLLSYQYLVTGSPFRSSYAVISAAGETSIAHSLSDIVEGAKLTLLRIVELGIWASPILLPVYLLCIVSKLRRRSIVFYDLIFPSFVVGYVFFPDIGGNRYGPRYYFDAFPLMMMTVVSAEPHATAWVRRYCNRPLAIHAALFGAVYLVLGLPLALISYHRQVEGRQEPYRLAMEKRLSNAIVIIRQSSARGLSAQDLARNDPTLQESILFARATTAPEDLRRVFPQRSIWTYDRDDPEQPGRLVPVPP